MKQEENATIEVDGPLGLKGRIRNIRMQDLLIVLIVVGISGFLWWSEEQRAKTYLEQHKITQQLITNVISNTNILIAKVEQSDKNTNDAISEQTYVTSLSQRDRESLRLEMPVSLRRKLRSN